MPLNKNLRVLRLQQHLSQADLDKLAGLPRGTVAHYESERRTPGIQNLKKLCEGLDCTMNELTD